MASPISDVVQGYNALASYVLEEWSALASRSASKVEAGAYDASSAAEDAAAGATLAAQTGWLWTSLWWESFARIAGIEGEPSRAESQPFHAPAGAALELAGPLEKGPGLDQLPTRAITIQPRQLAPGETGFVLRADGIVCRGGTYVGRVNATDKDGPKVVFVWITIP